MKKAILFLLITFSFYTIQAQQVGIGTNTPDSSAVLDIQSTTAGLLIPRMTTLQRTNIYLPKNGLMVYDTNTNSFWFYSNGAWLDLSSIPDGTGTDNQKIDTFRLVDTFLGISLEDDNEATKVVDLSSILNTDIGNVPFVTLTELEALTPENGQIVYNTTDDVTLMWNGIHWVILSELCFPQPTTPAAGADRILSVFNDTIISLSANTPLKGVGLWSSSNGGTFTDVNNSNTTFTGSICSEYWLYWTITSSCDVAVDSLFVQFASYTNAYAGTDQLINTVDTVVNLNANSIVSGIGVWSVTSGNGGVFADVNDPQTTFTGFNCEAYTLRWSVNNCTSAYDEVNIEFAAVPSVADMNSSNFINVTTKDDTVYNLSATPPTVGVGTWSVSTFSNPGTFSDIHDPNATFTGYNCSDYIINWTVSTGCSQTVDHSSLYFSYTESLYAGLNQVVSSEDTSVVLSADSAVLGEGTWSVHFGNGGSFSDVNDPHATFYGASCENYTLRWTSSDCNGTSDYLYIYFNEVTSNPDAGSNIYSLTDSVAVLNAGLPNLGSGVWSIAEGVGGSFSNVNDPNATFTGLNNTHYTLTWDVTNRCSNTSSADVDVFFGIVIGQYAYGGTIFFVDATNNHGLVIADEEFIASWGCQSTSIPGTSSNIGTGQANTNLILAGCATANIAARICDDFVSNTYSDWYLLSTSEFNTLQVNNALIEQTIVDHSGDAFSNYYYWTSTEFVNYIRAYTCLINSTYNSSTIKSADRNVRPIRSF